VLVYSIINAASVYKITIYFKETDFLRL